MAQPHRFENLLIIHKLLERERRGATRNRYCAGLICADNRSVVGGDRFSRDRERMDRCRLLAVTRQDNLNLMVAQVAKKVFNVPKVVARLFDPQRESIYRQFGIETICPTNVIADDFLDTLR